MKFVVIGEPSGASMDAIRAVYPRHKAVVDAFVAKGDVIGIGPFADLGNMVAARMLVAVATVLLCSSASAQTKFRMRQTKRR